MGLPACFYDDRYVPCDLHAVHYITVLYRRRAVCRAHQKSTDPCAARREGGGMMSRAITLEAQLPICWVPVLKSLYKFVLSITQGPTIWVPGLLGLHPIIDGQILREKV